MRIETRTAACGTVEYSALDVPHDWQPTAPLNHSEVVAFSKRIWRDQAWWGHKFADGSLCSGECAE